MKPGWRHHLFKTSGNGSFTPVAWDVPVTGATVTNDLSGPSAFDGNIEPEIPRLREQVVVAPPVPEKLVSVNQFTNPNFATSDVFSVSGQMPIVDGRGVLTGTGGSTYVGLLGAVDSSAWASVSADVGWVAGGAGRARLQVQFRSGGTTLAAVQTVVDKSNLPDGGRLSVKGVIPPGADRAIAYMWAYKEGAYTNLDAGQSLITDRWCFQLVDTEDEADAAAGEFFDGDTPAGDFVYRWAGEPDASVSEKLIPAVPAKTELGDPLIQNWQSVIVSERDGQIMGVSIVKDSPVDEGSMSLTGIGLAGYPTGMPFTGSFKGIEVDPIDQVRRIWDHLQGKPQGNLGVVIDDTKAPKGVTIGAEEKDVSFETGEGEQVEFQSGPYILAWYQTDDCGKEIEDLAEYTPFDYRMEHEWSGESFTSFLRIGTPKIGVRRSRPRFVVGENIIEFPGIERVGDDYANEVLCLGSGEATKMRRGTATVKTDRLRRAVVLADKSQRSNAAAEKAANAELKNRAGDPDITEITIMQHPNAEFNTWSLGDEILVTTPETWVKKMHMWCRVVSESWDCDKDTLKLTLKKV